MVVAASLFFVAVACGGDDLTEDQMLDCRGEDGEAFLACRDPLRINPFLVGEDPEQRRAKV